GITILLVSHGRAATDGISELRGGGANHIAARLEPANAEVSLRIGCGTADVCQHALPGLHLDTHGLDSRGLDRIAIRILNFSGDRGFGHQGNLHAGYRRAGYQVDRGWAGARSVSRYLAVEEANARSVHE